jgi:hypothetical protein
MKFTIKNRPKHPNIVWDQDYEHWFEGFEKELRDIEFHYISGSLPKRMTVKSLLKEILGE